MAPSRFAVLTFAPARDQQVGQLQIVPVCGPLNRGRAIGLRRVDVRLLRSSARTAALSPLMAASATGLLAAPNAGDSSKTTPHSAEPRPHIKIACFNRVLQAFRLNQSPTKRARAVADTVLMNSVHVREYSTADSRS